MESHKQFKKYTYLAILDENVIPNKEVLSYFEEMNITILEHYSKLNILKLNCDVELMDKKLKFIKSIELERSTNLLS